MPNTLIEPSPPNLDDSSTLTAMSKSTIVDLRRALEEIPQLIGRKTEGCCYCSIRVATTVQEYRSICLSTHKAAHRSARS